MAIKIEIKSTEVTNRDWEMNGRKGVSRSQIGYAHMPDKAYPVEIKIKLSGDNNAYPPGFYQIGPDSYYVGKGQLQLGKLQLVPIKQA